MPAWVPDLVVTLAILGVTYALYSEGAFGAATVTMNLIFSILIALNFYEPVAGFIVQNAGFMASFADLVSLGLIFLVSFAALKFGTEALSPTQLRLPTLVSVLARLGFGLLGATIVVAFALLLADTAPVHKKIIGIDYKTQPPWGQGIDRKLLGFMQYASGSTFPWPSEGSDPDYGSANVFDRDGGWLIEHQKARPYGEDEFTEAVAPAPVIDPATGQPIQP